MDDGGHDHHDILFLSMWQARLYGAGDLRFEEAPLDSSNLTGKQIYMETDVSALSTGTDLGNFSGDSTYVPGAPDYPRWVGYSNAGIVRAAGPDVTFAKAGERYFTTRPHLSAFIAEEPQLLARIPEGVPSEQASLAYLCNLGLQSLQKVGFRPGEDVAISGLGVIGLCTVSLARAMGAQSVIALANSPVRAEVARKMGATETIVVNTPEGRKRIEEGRDEMADIVVLTANSWDAYRDSMEIVRKCGRVPILGFPGRGQAAPDFNPLAPGWLYRKQLGLFGAGFAPASDVPHFEIRFNLKRNLAYLMELLAQKRMDFDPVISHRFAARRMLEAYHLAAQHSKEFTAAVFDWSEFHHAR